MPMTTLNPRFFISLQAVLPFLQVESMRREKYDSNNPSHEERLRDLWRLMVPSEVLEDRIGKQWRFIGFQVFYFSS